MPNDRPDEGMTTFSMHAFDSSSGGVVDELRSGRAGYAGVLPAGAGEEAVDPETAARRFLERALASDAVPALTAPVADGRASDFALINTETVRLTGTRMVKFRQTLHDIPVYGSLVSVELDEDNNLLSIDSTLGEPSGVDPVADVAPAAALRAAADAADGYTPALDGVVPRLSYYLDRSTSTWRLVYILQNVPVTLDRDAEAAADRSSGLEPPHIVDYVVDAHDGSVVALLPRTPSMAGQQQIAVDEFDAKRTFLASAQGAHLVLLDPDHNVETYDFEFADPAVEEQQLPGTAIANPPAWTTAAVSAHANAVVVSEFLRAVLKRDNIDDAGGAMRSTVNCVVEQDSPGPKQWVNAFWNGQQMVYGQVKRKDGRLRSLSANVDVVAHEMFHGVTDHTSRLEYAFQPGALNESYSDIFGTIVANLGNDDTRTWDWLLGQDLLPDDKPFRDMSDPKRFGQPAHMRDFTVLPNSRAGDWGGVHVNSGIHNKAAFNLLTARADDDTAALTPAEVAAVFYLALTQRLTRTSQFADSRRAAVASAQTLFRALAAQDRQRKVGAVEAAFDAVGIN
jgi:Zn-dependent metalloprotease